MRHISLGAFLVTASLLLVTGCSPSAPAPSGTPNGGAAPVAPATGKADTGKMTDDIFVELSAQEMYHDGIDPEAWGASGGGRDRLYARYGVTAEQASAFAESIGKNGGYDRAIQLMDRVDKRLKELQAGK
ncbi:MAG: hypothetical protein WCS85_04525 [Candidatus Peribacteraceae bacterium]|jgi:hypothetical protein